MAEACVVVQIALSLLMALLDYGTQADILRGNLFRVQRCYVRESNGRFSLQVRSKTVLLPEGQRSPLQFPYGRTAVSSWGNSSFPTRKLCHCRGSVKPVDKFFVCVELNVLPYPYGMQGIEDNLLFGRRHGYDTPTAVEITSTPEVCHKH